MMIPQAIKQGLPWWFSGYGTPPPQCKGRGFDPGEEKLDPMLSATNSTANVHNDVNLHLIAELKILTCCNGPVPPNIFKN